MPSALLRRLLFHVALLAASGGAEATPSIVVQEEFGFTFLAGDSWQLRLGGASRRYQDVFDLSFRDGVFVMTARADNDIAEQGGLPYGLDIYRGGKPRVPPIDGGPPTTSFGFVPWFEFPDQRGEQLRVELHSLVPEPQAAGLLSTGLLALLLGAQARKPRLRRLVSKLARFGSSSLS